MYGTYICSTFWKISFFISSSDDEMKPNNEITTDRVAAPETRNQMRRIRGISKREKKAPLRYKVKIQKRFCRAKKAPLPNKVEIQKRFFCAKEFFCAKKAPLRNKVDSRSQGV